MQVNIRKATREDRDFLADIILKAEETGCELVSYSKMFEQSNKLLQPKITKAINNDIEGHPFTYTTFFIAELDGKPAAAISAYVEGTNGDSNHLITGALMSAFSREELKKGFSLIGENKEIQIQKNKDVLQLDSIATLPAARGKGVFSALLDFILKYYKNEGVKKAEIQVWKKNLPAIGAYQKHGFSIIKENISNKDKDNGKILMQKEL